jgi:hypothetical protein
MNGKIRIMMVRSQFHFLVPLEERLIFGRLFKPCDHFYAFCFLHNEILLSAAKKENAANE